MKYLILLLLFTGCASTTVTECVIIADAGRTCKITHNSKSTCFSERSTTKKIIVHDCKIYDFFKQAKAFEEAKKSSK